MPTLSKIIQKTQLRLTYQAGDFDQMKLNKLNIPLLVFLLSACTSAPITLSERQQLGQVSFQSIENYQVEEDGFGGIYVSSPDGEIGIIMQVSPSDSFTQEMIPAVIGGQYPEEGFPFAMLLFLGFENITLKDLRDFKLGGYSGYSRAFVATNQFNQIEGEYVFFPVGDQTFIAMGSVIKVTGDNHWNPEGKAAFDAIVGSVQFQ